LIFNDVLIGTSCVESVSRLTVSERILDAFRRTVRVCQINAASRLDHAFFEPHSVVLAPTPLNSFGQNVFSLAACPFSAQVPPLLFSLFTAACGMAAQPTSSAAFLFFRRRIGYTHSSLILCLIYGGRCRIRGSRQAPRIIATARSCGVRSWGQWQQRRRCCRIHEELYLFQTTHSFHETGAICFVSACSFWLDHRVVFKRDPGSKRIRLIEASCCCTGLWHPTSCCYSLKSTMMTTVQ
jgi:hypothetical protein